MMKNDCKNNCLRCGICCVCRRIIDFELNFYKPAFYMCPHLELINDIAYCNVFNTEKMPKQCQNNSWTRIKDSCLSAYRHTEGMNHLLWAKNLGYLDKLRIINNINTKQYDCLNFAIQTFILPYLKHVPKTLACSYNWLKDWGICDYINNIPQNLENSFFTQIDIICRRNYKKDEPIPNNVLECLKKPHKPITMWLKQLKKIMWS